MNANGGWLVGLVALALFASVGAAASSDSDRPARPPIREFDVDTLSRLGREIFRHDQLAWIATDALFAQIDQRKYIESGAAGWVVDVSAETPVVRFVRRSGDTVEVAYDVQFAPDRKPEVVTPEDRVLTATQLAAFRAARTGLDALAERRLPWCGGNPNYVVLLDPDGDGFLVYVLRPKPAMRAVPIGGHYRISVSADGESIEQVDQLFASCLTLDSEQVTNEGGEVAGLYMSHIVSATPLETHVFLSLQEKLPFSVITPDARTWSVDNGTIRPLN